jgi:hypothetical protein
MNYTDLKQGHKYNFYYIRNKKYFNLPYVGSKYGPPNNRLFSLTFKLNDGKHQDFVFQDIKGLQPSTPLSLQELAGKVVDKNIEEERYDDTPWVQKEYLPRLGKGGKRKSITTKNKKRNKKRTFRKRIK